MNRNRILMRLRSKHAKSTKKPDRCPILTRLTDMVNGVGSLKLLDQATTARVIEVKSPMKQLMEVFNSLEKLPANSLQSGRFDDRLLRLLRLFDDLPSTTDLTRILGLLPSSSISQGQEAVVTAIMKLRKYRTACDYLVRVARRFSIFRRIEVSAVKIDPLPLRILPYTDREQRFLACIDRVGVAWNGATEQRLGVSQSQACTQFTRELASLKPKVHAEIQLLFHYEINSTLKRPRVICSSKNACFLCGLFVRLHGKFFMERTHGVLYPKWTLPTVTRILSPEKMQAMDEVINMFRQRIQAEIRRNLANVGMNRAHPSESAASLTHVRPWMRSDEYVDRESVLSVGPCSPGLLAVKTETDDPRSVQQRCEIGAVVEQKEFKDGIKPRKTPSQANTPPQTVDQTVIEALKPECPGDNDDASFELKMDTSNMTYPLKLHPSLDNEGCPKRSDLRAASQFRSSIDLDCVQRQQTASTMRGHGSRTSDTPAKCDTPDFDKGDDHVVSHLAGVSQRIDFHELELFSEFPGLAAVIEVARLDSTPAKPYVGSVVDVGSLVPGDELVVDLGEDLKQERILFLTRRDRSGMQSWWKVSWEHVAAGEAPF